MSTLELSRFIPLNALESVDKRQEDLATEHLSRASIKLDVQLSQSVFTDHPAGNLNVVVKSVGSTNGQLISSSTKVRVLLLSRVPRDRVVLEESSKPRQGKSGDQLRSLQEMPFSDGDDRPTLAMTSYGDKTTPGDDFRQVLVNHVTNLVARHFQDKVRIEVY